MSLVLLLVVQYMNHHIEMSDHITIIKINADKN